ncbi:MAG: di-trans,poly-cis-decaprenylcistransferase [Clostridia bacterium]|nr:di-trans,poly-cis-decaprenylcistransferase [Clostridia bacterium]
MFFNKKKNAIVNNDLKHIAFIMDGNGRWAKSRGLPRKAGHKQGAKALENIGKICSEYGINTVTVYAFSTENWSRPKNEVDAIIDLLRSYIKDAKKRKEVRYKFIGDKSVLPQDLIVEINELEEITKNFDNVLNIAFNYGGRAEIVYACNELIKEGKTVITEEDISSHIYTSHSKDPDLIVRTAGEYRLSNFLLWQCAYSEFYFTDVYWPNFDRKELEKAIESFNNRKRRYGGLIKGEE